MKYEYGVEYETNGRKPDLPDDIVIECFDGVEWWGGYDFFKNTALTPNLLAFTGQDTEKFRIVDKRYKPKEQDMSDWYENGELPPVGENVDYEGTVVEVLFHDKRLPQVCVQHADGQLSILQARWLKPIRTEMDKLVEQMELSFESTGCVFTNDHRALAEHLIEQNYRKIKQTGEEDFLEHLSLMFGIGSIIGSELYQAGCRFIEQGE